MTLISDNGEKKDSLVIIKPAAQEIYSLLCTYKAEKKEKKKEWIWKLKQTLRNWKT